MARLVVLGNIVFVVISLLRPFGHMMASWPFDPGQIGFSSGLSPIFVETLNPFGLVFPKHVNWSEDDAADS